MPNRILRDCTDSEPVNTPSDSAEKFFYRLIQKADDFGRFHGDPKLLRPLLYPRQLDRVREADIERWIKECEAAGRTNETPGLVRFYVAKGKKVLEISKFDQRTRAVASKFPSFDGQMTVNCQSDDSQPRTETETVFGDVGVADAHVPTLDEVKKFAISVHCGFPPDRVEEWYHDQQANGWKYAQSGKAWQSRMLSDRNREYWRKRKPAPSAEGPNI